MRIKIGAKRIPREKDTIDIDVCYAETLWGIEKGAELFQVLEELELLPNKFQSGLKKEPFEIAQLNALLRKMWLPVVWFNPDEARDEITLRSLWLFRSITPKYWSSISRSVGGARAVQSDIGFCIESQNLSNVDGAKKIDRLFLALLSYGKVDFARIQYYSAEENDNSLRGREPQTTVASRTLVDACIPDLYNVTVWGGPYIKFFGKERLLSAPCYKVEELPSGLIWMQLSPEVYVEQGCWTALKEVRKRVKAHLNNNAFRDPSLPHNHKYSIPQFDLSEVQKPLKVPEGVKR